MISTSSAPSSSEAASEAAYFDTLAQTRGAFNPFADRGWQTLAERFAHCVEGRSSLDILEVGCGTGQSRMIYAPFARNLIGIDLARDGLRIANDDYPTDEWLCADAVRLPMAEASLDLVAFSSVLHHIPNFVNALREARRVLKPGGIVFAFDPNAWHPAMGLFRVPKSPFYIAEGVSPNECPLTASQLREAFTEAGFELTYLRSQSNIPYRKVAPVVINSLLSLYNVADRAWELSGLGRWFGTFLITCGRKPRVVSY
jgi:ubiquinone/menaquinone biosynthesis C-methylase UbiE